MSLRQWKQGDGMLCGTVFSKSSDGSDFGGLVAVICCWVDFSRSIEWMS